MQEGTTIWPTYEAQTLVLVAVLALLGQAMVAPSIGSRRRDICSNRLFELIALQCQTGSRCLAEGHLDRHVRLLPSALLLVVYFLLGFEHRESCKAQLTQAGCGKVGRGVEPAATTVSASDAPGYQMVVQRRANFALMMNRTPRAILALRDILRIDPAEDMLAQPSGICNASTGDRLPRSTSFGAGGNTSGARRQLFQPGFLHDQRDELADAERCSDERSNSQA